jgi:hypothetical protein
MATPGYKLGTILPTKESLRRGDEHAAYEAGEREVIARKLFAGLTRRVVGGEVRYYYTASTYGIIGRDKKPRWFEVREDGDWPITR